MKQIRNNVFETNSSSSHSITLSITDVNGKIIPDVIKCKPFWQAEFEYQGKIADNISLVLAAVWKDEMKLPISYSTYESEFTIDSYTETVNTPTELLEKFKESNGRYSNDAGILYAKYLKQFVTTEAYKAIVSEIKQVFPSSKIEIFDELTPSKIEEFYKEDTRLQITGLGKILEYIEYDSEYHTVNKEKFKFFLQYAAEIMNFETEITEYCEY